MKRLLDILIASGALVILSLPMLVIAVLIRLMSRESAIYWSKRLGRGNRIFLMPKFRTMRSDAPQVATHLLLNSKRWITREGHFLRKTSLDELPQLWSILIGDMSLVGPRPALFNQDDLVSQRTELGIQELVPGLTGWAQVNGRDGLEVCEKVAYDEYYRLHQSVWFDMQILLLTFVKVLQRDGVQQADDAPTHQHIQPPTNRRAA